MSKRAPKRTAVERRRLILESAQTVFANSNYARTGTADLAKAAGVSEPALYRYFSGKKDLYVSTLQATRARLLRIWERLAIEAKNPLDAVWTIGMGYYDHSQSREPVMKLFYEALSEADDPEIRTVVRDSFVSMVRFIAERLEEGKAQGLVRRDVNTRVAAWQFMATGLAFDLINMLGLQEEVDRDKAEHWGRLYMRSMTEKARGAVEPEDPAA